MAETFSLNNIEMYILLFFTYAFAGWIMESIGGIFKVKKFVNRGFLIGPYCPVYGVGVVLITILLKNYTNDIPVLFILSTVICGTLEYATSYFMEKFFNARWWDYHNRKFNINGRICLETLLPFGIVGSTILCIINPFFIDLYLKIPNTIRHIITGVLTILFIIDCILSLKIISSFKGITYSEKDNTEEISNKVKDKTEDILMKAESDAIVFTRRLKLKRLKFQRKVRYTRKELSNAMTLPPRELAKLLNERRENVIKKIENEKEKINYQIKMKKEEFIENQKQNKEFFEKSIKKRIDELEKFQSKSILNKRLMEAFPNLEIKISNKKEKKNR